MRSFLKILLVNTLIILYAPIFILLTSSLSVGENHFSFQWYKQLFVNKDVLNAIKNSFTVTITASVVAVTLGILMAYGLYKYKKRSWLNRLIDSVIIIPDISLSLGLFMLFRLLHLPFGLTTIIIPHITFGIAFSTIIIAGRLKAINPELEMAARDLGASETRIIIAVIAPFIAPSIAGAFLVTFTLSWDDFVFAYFNSGAGVRTLPVEIFMMIKKGITPEINAIAALSMIFSLFIIYTGWKLTKFAYVLK